MKRAIMVSLIMLCIGFSFGKTIVASNRLWYNFINYYTFPQPATDL